MKSAFQLHVERWTGCTACPLSERRTNVVLARGKLPCAVLFVGEAPGVSEDVVGAPFVGPAGRLLDHIIRRALPEGTRYALTNVVACIPLDEDGEKVHEPPDDAARACSGRLRELAALARPNLVVAVGAEARDWLDVRRRDAVPLPGNPPRVDVVHPAHILRSNYAAQELMVQRCIVTVANACEEHLR